MFTSLKQLFARWKGQQHDHQSPVQILLDQWDQHHPFSHSQQREAKKHQKIHHWRDYPKQKQPESESWLDQDDIQ